MVEIKIVEDEEEVKEESPEKKEIERLRKKSIEIKKKNSKFSFHSGHRFRFPITWTLFFIIIGLVQETIITKKLDLAGFFVYNYLTWIYSFGGFAQVYYADGINSLILMIIRHWYYFFITGGLLSVLWAILYALTHIERKKKDEIDMIVGR